MSDITLTLFGSPSLSRTGDRAEFRSRKRLALLAYLALSGTPHRRAEIQTLFRPESDGARAQVSLRRTLTLLRHALHGAWLWADRESVGLDQDLNVAVDVLQFGDLLSRCQTHGHRADQMSVHCLPLPEQAAALYRGDFGAGFSLTDNRDFGDWQSLEAGALRRELVRLGHAACGLGEPAQARDYFCQRDWMGQ